MAGEQKSSVGGNISIGQSGGININATSGSTAGRDVVGRDYTPLTTRAVDATKLHELFQQIVKRVDELPGQDEDEKKELKETVQKIEAEVKKGQEAKPDKVERWLKFVASMSADIAEVLSGTLVNPAAGVGTAIRLVAIKAKDIKY
jgi:hypothetical protein